MPRPQSNAFVVLGCVYVCGFFCPCSPNRAPKWPHCTPLDVFFGSLNSKLLEQNNCHFPASGPKVIQHNEMSKKEKRGAQQTGSMLNQILCHLNNLVETMTCVSVCVCVCGAARGGYQQNSKVKCLSIVYVHASVCLCTLRHLSGSPLIR